MRIALTIICFLLAANCVSLNAQKGTKAKIGYKVGDTAKDVSLTNIDGEEVTLTDLDAKGYIVVFTSNVCPFAQMYEDRLIELHNKMAPKGYPVVAINSNDPVVEAGDSFVHMQERAEDKAFPFVYLKDAKYSVYADFGATKTPHVFLLDEYLTVQYIGAIDDNAKRPENVGQRYVENAIMALEDGTSPDPSFTKAIGCSIKTKNSRGVSRRNSYANVSSILESMDSNNDAQISKAEAQGKLAINFDKIDKDADGFISEAELQSITSMKKNNKKKEEK